MSEKKVYIAWDEHTGEHKKFNTEEEVQSYIRLLILSSKDFLDIIVYKATAIIWDWNLEVEIDEKKKEE